MTQISDSSYKQLRTFLFVIALALFVLVALSMFLGMGRLKIIPLMPTLPFVIVTGMMYNSVRRLWKVQVLGDKLVAERGKKRIEFGIGNIHRIELMPNWWANRNTVRPFTILVFHHSMNGFDEIRFISNNDHLEEQLLINPWRKLAHERGVQIQNHHHSRR